MRIALAADHAAVAYKAAIAAHLRAAGHTVTDHGTQGEASVDYPDYAERACRDWQAGKADAVVLVCGTGIGMSLTANRFPGLRCAVIYNVETAKLAKEHNNAQAVAIGARQVDQPTAIAMVDAWLNATFEQRHQRRLDKIARIESEQTGCGSTPPAGKQP